MAWTGGKDSPTVIAAGNTVAVAITTPSGRGVLFVELDDRGREITDVSVFHNEA